ncbi:MAG: DegT/DnrJ/EryC1/StrS family aminotransferase [Gaiellaceae bacterium]
MTEIRWQVPLSDLTVDDELVEAALGTFRSGWWSMGPRVEEFEREFAAFCGAGEALAVANGTAALHLALVALGCGPGDEVIVPSLNFVAAANAIAVTGAEPVFCDITGPDDLNLDSADVAAAITLRTKAIVALHYAGVPCDMEALGALGPTVIEDAAHAPGASVGGRMCGTLGRVGCFSFFANKNLPVGEGGMMVTADAELADRLRLLRSHGMTTLTWDRHRGHASSYDVVVPGFNYRLDEVRAAVGLVQLRRLTDENAARGRIAARYREALSNQQGLIVPFEPRDGVTPSYHLAVVVLPEGVDRDAVRAALAERGIQTSVHYPPIHLFSAYRTRSRRSLPRTEAVAGRILTLPLYGAMRDEQVEAVIEALLQTL